MKASSRRTNSNPPNASSSNRLSLLMPCPRPIAAAAAVPIQFINAAHPDESNSAQSLSQIRSHAARQVHAQRRLRKAAAHKGVGGGGGSGSGNGASSSIVGSTKHVPVALAAAAAATVTAAVTTSFSADRDAEQEYDHWEDQGLRRIAPRTRETVQYILARVQKPRQMIGDTRRDACQGAFAWTLSSEEYHNEWVIDYGYKGCIPDAMMPTYLKAMKTVYVPYAIAHPCLLTAMLYVASQRCSTNASSPEEAKRHELMALHYRLKCIQMMKQAVSKDAVADDATIALGMVMSAESFREGDSLGSDFHGQATIKMIGARGGSSPSSPYLAYCNTFSRHLCITQITNGYLGHLRIKVHM
ncbi:hypothetical protein PT974_06732 [Cladobotryum mycophilum]|uniref:Uncharacterized protein n=1 Tax=Cladobotryum mycophilum TaxID=491253 RepID=A0ABR0SMI0_9HYPO